MTVERTSSRFTQHLYSLLVTNFVFAFASLVRETAASNPFSFSFFFLFFIFFFFLRGYNGNANDDDDEHEEPEMTRCNASPKKGVWCYWQRLENRKEKYTRERAVVSFAVWVRQGRQVSRRRGLSGWMYSTVQYRWID
ncbi:hypothetical protein HDK77DRAFT_305829 [Phyllosticta capitalensis]